MRTLFKKIIAVMLVAIVVASTGISTLAAGVNVNSSGGLKVINAKDGLYLSWNKVDGATGYRVNKFDPLTKKWSLIIGVKGNCYQDNRVMNGLDYTYKISYINKNGDINTFNHTESLKCLKMPKVTLSCTPNSVMVKWDRFSTATQYRVYRKADKETSWKCIKVVKNTSTSYLMDYSVKSGEKYTYTVKQVSGSVPGSYNISGVSTTYWAAPRVTSKHSPDGVVLNWGKYSNKHTYIIDHRSDSSTTWRSVGEIYDKGIYTCPYSKIDFGVVNYFRIRLKNTNLVSYSTSVNGIDPAKPMVALTYDDGPFTSVTDSIVSTLKANGARATFFVVGNRVNSYKTSLKNAFDAGCEIANHTHGHYILTRYDAKTIQSQINQANQAVKKITGKAPTLVRAPGGSINSTVKSAVKYPLIQWSVDTLDWKSRNAKSVVSVVKSNTKDGSIILMHDLYESTAEATKTIVPWLKSQGYQMVTVTELMQIRGYDLKAGEIYYSGYRK